MINSDSADFKFQKRGHLVNVNESQYHDYIDKRNILLGKEQEILELKTKINMLEDKFNKILENIR